MAVEQPVAMSDDAWRSERFTEEEIVSSKWIDATVGAKQPTFKQLKEALEQYGPDGILESAMHLGREEFEKLEKLVKKAPGPKPVARRRKRR